MGKRGPAPKPTALRVLHGDRPDRINNDEPQPASDEIAAPGWLNDDAREVWDAKAPDLIRKRCLTPWDVEEFASYCDTVIRKRRAAAALDAEGEIVDLPVFNKNGEHTGDRRGKNPWALIWKEASEMEARYAAKFGLTPSDRSGLNVKGADDAGQGAKRLLA